jgi:3-phosphoshikimate 1-carboxyvinyltransferase
MKLITAPAAAPLRGELTPPGDKSISHRALIFACLAHGPSRVRGLLESADVAATANACRQLGMALRQQAGEWLLEGVGERGLQAPGAPLDMGNSGTAMRLLAGVLAAQPFASELVGDASLSRRPMRRIVAPLEQMGARIATAAGGTPPLRISGTPGLRGIDYVSPIASAQVKSCLLLAGLYASGHTTVREPLKSRDHTEKMLPAFGVPLYGDCGCARQPSHRGLAAVPATFVRGVPAAAAALVPARTCCCATSGERDARWRRPGAAGRGRPHRARPAPFRRRAGRRHPYSPCRPAPRRTFRWTGARADRRMPVILALAATAEGTTRCGAAELRVKESDRLAVMGRGLRTPASRSRSRRRHGRARGPIRGGAVDGRATIAAP